MITFIARNHPQYPAKSKIKFPPLSSFWQEQKRHFSFLLTGGVRKWWFTSDWNTVFQYIRFGVSWQHLCTKRTRRCSRCTWMETKWSLIKWNAQHHHHHRCRWIVEWLLVVVRRAAMEIVAWCIAWNGDVATSPPSQHIQCCSQFPYFTPFLLHFVQRTAFLLLPDWSTT